MRYVYKLVERWQLEVSRKKYLIYSPLFSTSNSPKLNMLNNLPKFSKYSDEIFQRNPRKPRRRAFFSLIRVVINFSKNLYSPLNFNNIWKSNDINN